MNEPSAFEGPEATVPRDALHYGGIEHRNIHNMYGFLQTKATYDGLLRRGNGEIRPFILTRSFFSGSQVCILIIIVRF
jgi:mannosyl-oligosaccharide alpha-1,3-glucosidase